MSDVHHIDIKITNYVGNEFYVITPVVVIKLNIHVNNVVFSETKLTASFTYSIRFVFQLRYCKSPSH